MPMTLAATMHLAAMAAAAVQDKTAAPPAPAASPTAELRAPPVWDPAVVNAPRSQRPTPRPVNPSAWISADDYPAAAKRAGAEGYVSYRLQVDAQGRPTNCQVLTGSGNVDLDSATCTLIASRGRFEPALDLAGKPVAGTFTSRLRWALSDKPRDLPKEGELIVTLTAAPDGSVTDCTFTAKGAPSNAPDPCKGARFAPQTGPDAKAQRVRFTTRVEYLDPQ